MEGELRRGAVSTGIATSEAALGLAVASRTDRGVHARANVLVLRSDLTGAGLLGALNGIAPDLWATRAAPVAATFDERRPAERWYRYFDAPTTRDRPRWRAAAARFRGPIDVRSFARGLPPEPAVLRPITSVRVSFRRTATLIDVRAPSFVWGMVRKIVAALRAHASGELELARLRRALAGEERLPLPLAEAERLVLWRVHHPVEWTDVARLERRRPYRHVAAERLASQLRGELLRELLPRVRRIGGP